MLVSKKVNIHNHKIKICAENRGTFMKQKYVHPHLKYITFFMQSFSLIVSDVFLFELGYMPIDNK